MLNLCKRRLFLTKSNYALASKRLTSKYTIAIRREDNVVWERRAPLAPTHVRKLVQDGIRVLVQPANKRAFPVQEYVSSGAEIVEDISEASVILGVKQVPIESLIPNKTYIFFSHVIKAQSENMAMLDAILEKNIRLIDYEKMEENSGKRVVAFGMYAGYAGMINILHGMGLRMLALGHHTPFMHIGIAHNYRTSGQAVQAVRDAGYEISLGRMPESVGPLTFVFTGAGNVSQGAQEIFRELPHVYVQPHELKDVAEKGDTSVVYGCVVDMHDHLQRKSDGGYDMQEYIQSPHLYESIFAKEIAPYASCIMNGIFWRPHDPRLLTNDDIVSLQLGEKSGSLRQGITLDSPGCPGLPHRLIAVGDVSADPGGSLEFMTECTSIDAPFNMYDAGRNSSESHGVKGPGILICSVDNLPAQLPREATQFFGDQLLPYMFHIADNDANASFSNIKKMSSVVTNAIITSNGKMTPKFEYIQDMRRKREQEGAMSATSSKNYKVLVLGAGYVSHPLVDYMTRHNDTEVTVASSLLSEVKSLSGKYKHANPIVIDIELESERLEELVKGHDLVISLLPYAFHPKIADLCIDNKKNLVTASYVSDPIKERHQRAVDSGIGIVMEVGVDPGIDHMLAMEAFDDIKLNGGKVTSFISYCGGLPAPELSSNPLKYKFSWSPVGVLMVTLAPSKYLKNNQIIEHKEGGENYRNGVIPIEFMPGFSLEGLANRDSTSYKEKYGLYDCETVIRGTLRYKGFSDVVVGLLNLGLITLDPHPLLTKDSPDITWKQFLSHLLTKKQDVSDQELRDCVFKAVEESETRVRAIEELGLMSDTNVEKAKTPIQSLAYHLNKILSYGKGERDMIILRHEIEGSYADKYEKRDIDMVVYGDPEQYSAMAKCVGYPCAIAARMMLLGKIQDKGIITPFERKVYQPLLKELRHLGITAKTSFRK